MAYTDAVGASPGEPPPTPSIHEPRLTEEEANQLMNDIKQLADEADRVLALRESEHTHFELTLEGANYELEQIFEWVRAETRWVPYRGVLRGAGGVLMDRRGNSLDRSLLLARLLEDAGFETRLARTTLDKETAAALLESQTTKASAPDPLLEPGREIGPVRTRLEELRAQSLELATFAGFTPPRDSRQPAEDALHDIADHWWVQARQGSTWHDLDLMIPVRTSKQSSETPSFHLAENLPKDLYHRLELRVVVERWENGRLHEEVPLVHGFAVAEVAVFPHLEIAFLPIAEEWFARDHEALGALQIADEARFWRPTLKIEEETIFGRWFSAAGQLEQPTAFVAARKLERAAEALTDLDSPRQEERSDTHLTAAWLEYELSIPGHSGELVRRELFDLVGIDRQRETAPHALRLTASDRRDRGLALQGRTSSLVLTSSPQGEAVLDALIASLRDNRDGLIALVHQTTGRQDERVPEVLRRIPFYPVDLLAMACLRELWSRHGDLVYLDRPNILSSHLVRVARGSTSELQFATDVVVHRLGVVPGSSMDPRLVRLEQGVLDTMVETVFSGGLQVDNTFQHFANRSEGHGDWIKITATSSADEFLPAWPAGDQMRIRAAVRGGSVALVAPRSYDLGGHSFASWWLVDLSDGTTLGHGYRGWGGRDQRACHAGHGEPAGNPTRSRGGW